MTIKHCELFESTVELYKLLGDNVSVENGVLSLVEGVNPTLTEKQATLLSLLYSNKSLFREFKLQIDYDDEPNHIGEGEPCNELKIEFNLFTGNEFCLYKNEHELVQNLSTFVIQGRSLPKWYYFADEDFKSNSPLKHTSIIKLEKLAKWFHFLTEISDIDKKIDNGIALYYFIKGEDDKYAKPLEVKIDDLKELIEIEKISSIEDISKLISEDEEGNLHHRDRQSFFKLALVDTLKKLLSKDTSGKSEAAILFSNLGEVKKSYYEHYDVFIHNFAIGEFQQEVEEKGFDYAEKVSAVLNDIQIRLYAIPIVLVSLGALAKVDNIYSYFFIICGVIITALFNHWMIGDQVLRLEQIKTSSSFTFDKLREQCSEKLNSKSVLSNLDKIVDNIDNRIADRNTKIRYYRLLCWLPTLVAIIALSIKERQSIFGYFGITVDIKQDNLLCILSNLIKLIIYIIQ